MTQINCFGFNVGVFENETTGCDKPGEVDNKENNRTRVTEIKTFGYFGDECWRRFGKKSVLLLTSKIPHIDSEPWIYIVLCSVNIN